MRAWATALLLVGGLALAGCTSTGTTGKVAATSQAEQSSSSATAAAAANVGASGATFDLTDSKGLKATVTATLVSKTTGTGAIAQNPAHGVFEEADVKIVVDAGSFDYNAANFQFLGSDGNTYTFGGGNIIGAGVDPMLTDGTLTVGQSAGGWVVFDVPPGGGTLQLQGDALGGSIAAQWKVGS